jgi:urease gamma subunit
MRYRILLTASAFVSLFTATAQQKTTRAFAITSTDKGSFQWTDVRLIDVGTGQIVRSVFDSKQAAVLVNARSGKTITAKQPATASPAGQATGTGRVITRNPAMASGNNDPAFNHVSAACAYDVRHNRLYYTPMFVNELRYIDLGAKTPTIYTFNTEAFSNNTNPNTEANHITRMTIGADGRGYALSNDGNHLVRFTTNRKAVISDLGALNDDPANGAISVHAKATSWGGDMVASADGSLYLFTAFQHVFKINIGTKTATYITKLQGLPEKYTTNGAAVNEEGKLVVSSANSTDGYYEVDMENWQATRITTNDKVFNTSDLATANLAFNKGKTTVAPAVSGIAYNRIGVYPNPVTTGSFRVTFNGRENGRYNIQVFDLAGKIVVQKPVVVGIEGQVAEVNVGKGLANGTYLVKVVNPAQKAVYMDKIIIAD